LAKIKTRKPEMKQKEKPAENIFDKDWICLSLLVIFWVIFFRQLLTGSAFLFDDFIEQYYPGKLMASVSLKSGIFPFWNPFVFSGMPFFADLQIAVLYPFNLLLTLFTNGDKLSPLPIQFTIVLHYLLCSVFTFYLGKQFKLSNIFSVLFALLFTYSSYMIIHIIHMPLIEAAVWFPLILLLWLKFTETKKYFYAISAGIIMTVCILAGYPQVPFFNYFFIAIFAAVTVYRKYMEKDTGDIKHIAAGFLIFLILPFGLTAFQLLPTNEFVSLSNRASFDYDFAKQGSLHPYELITVIMPKYFGVWSGNEKITDLQYWSKHSEGPWMFSISNIFISALILVLIIPAVRYLIKEKKNPYQTYFLLGISVFSVLFSFGGYFFFHKLLFDFVPLFNRFRNPAHILYLLSFSVILLSMLGTNGIIKDKKLKDYFSSRYLAGIAIVFAFIGILFYAGVFAPQTAKGQGGEAILSWIKSQYAVFIVFIFGFTFLLYLLKNLKISFQSFSVLIALLLCTEFYYIWFDQNNGTRNPEQAYTQNSATVNKLKEEMKNEHFRVNMREGRNMLFQRNQGFIDRIEFIEGYGALLLKRFIPVNKPEPSSQTHDLMNIKYKINVDPVKKTMQLLPNPGYLPRARMFYDVKLFNNEDEVKKYMESPEFDYRKTIAIEKDKLGTEIPVLKDTLNIPASNVKISEYTLSNIQIDVETPANGFLFLSEVYYPAWKAYIDGKETEIFKTDYCLRSVYLTQGKHEVEFKYESDTFNTGLIISLGFAVFLIPSFGFSVYRLKQDKIIALIPKKFFH
jgi:hypothetical protein